MDIPALLPTHNNSKFDFQGQKLLLTYPTHLDKEECITSLALSAGGRSQKPFEFKFIRCAHEIGNANGVEYPHTHVLIDFGRSFKARDCRRFDLRVDEETLHPNWHPIKTQTHWRNSLNYIAKEDPENEDLKSAPSIAQSIWACATPAEALEKHMRNPSDAPGILAAFAAKPRDESACNTDDVFPDYPWQKKICKLIEGKPSPSAVHWIFDPWGQNGKTTLTRFLCASKRAYMCKHSGGSINFATIVQSAINGGWDQRCWIFDLSRSTEDNAIYGPIEDIKDGMITASKYRGESLVFKRPHVFVMANFLPKLLSLSLDRWNIYQILDHDLVKLDTFKLLKHPEYGARARMQKGVSDDLLQVVSDASDLQHTSSPQVPLGEGGLTLKAPLSPPADNLSTDDLSEILDDFITNSSP